MKQEYALQYLNIRIDNKSIRAIQGSGSKIVIAKDSIKEVSIIETLSSDNPWLVFLVGVALIAFGLLLIPFYVNWYITGGKISIYYFLWLTWSFLGTLICYDAFKKKIHLKVSTTNGTKKILFDGKIEEDKLIAFVQSVNQKLDYKIALEIERLNMHYLQ